MRYLYLLLFLLVSSCTNLPYRGCDVCGPEDFVIDSYHVREGKFAVLEMDGHCYDSLSEELLEEYRDVICDGDLLHIAIHHPTRKDVVAAIDTIGKNIGFRVIDGKITLPDLGEVEVEGLTLSGAKEKIESVYRGEIADIEVFISYRDRKEGKVELMGMVQLPSVPVDGKIRLFDVLSMAKVPTNANLFKSYVVRGGQLLPVDLVKLVKEGDMSQNIVMRREDKIYIAEPSASSIMVLGEVSKPRVIHLTDGYMTLRQAIGEVGGIPYTGDRRYIQVIRGSVLCPKIYTIHWQHLIRLPSESLLLIPGDIVYVAATPIAQWDRFVNQILPTLVGLDLILRGAKGVGVIVP
ncbi:MAG: hypothetical protein KR126chlam1_01199 [Chlamydiae bacterium]|nr:hypothetical protein [Chlamydiota bacterium]